MEHIIKRVEYQLKEHKGGLEILVTSKNLSDFIQGPELKLLLTSLNNLVMDTNKMFSR